MSRSHVIDCATGHGPVWWHDNAVEEIIRGMGCPVSVVEGFREVLTDVGQNNMMQINAMNRWLYRNNIDFYMMAVEIAADGESLTWLIQQD